MWGGEREQLTGCGVPEPWQNALPIPPLPTLAAPVVPQPGSQLLVAAGVNPFLNSLLSPLFLPERRPSGA